MYGYPGYKVYHWRCWSYRNHLDRWHVNLHPMPTRKGTDISRLKLAGEDIYVINVNANTERSVEDAKIFNTKN